MLPAIDHNELLAGYGRSVGVESAAFDGDGEAHLAFDDIVVHFRHDAARQQIVLSAPVFDGAVAPDIEVYASLLELNLGGILHDSGSVGLDKDTGAVIFSNAISLVGLDQVRFDAFIAAGVDLVEAWRKLVESDNFPRAIEKPQQSAPADDDAIAMIRI